jgi:membrane-bound lytic murein transglycosylase D
VASIARKYKVNADQVSQWNKVGMSANFKQGQQVVVFLSGTSQSRKSSAATRPTAHRPAPHVAVTHKPSGARPTKR